MTTVPTAETLREEELQTFFKMRNMLENRNTYIGMLFNQELTDWFVRQVENDFSTDIMKDLTITERRLDDANKNATEYFNENVRLQKKLDESVIAISERDVRIGLMREKNKNQGYEIEELKMKRSQMFFDFENSVNEYERKLKQTRGRVRKAFERMRKIFDDREAKWEFLFNKLK